MGRTAEGRSELVELADDSASSANVTIPSSPRRAGSMTERTGVPLYTSSREAEEQLEHEMQGSLSRKDSRVHTRIDSTDLDHAEERREIKQSGARPGRAPQDHHPGARAMLNMTARDQLTTHKKHHREAKCIHILSYSYIFLLVIIIIIVCVCVCVCLCVCIIVGSCGPCV